MPFRPVPTEDGTLRPHPELSMRPVLLPLLVAVFHLFTSAWWLALCDVFGALVLLRVILFCRRARAGGTLR